MKIGHSENKKKKSDFWDKFNKMFIPKKGDSKRILISKIIAILAAVLIIFSIIMIGSVIHKYSSKDRELDKARELYPSSSVLDDIGSSSIPDNVWVDESVGIDTELNISKDFADLYKTNPNVIGYIKILGTKLDMPVVQGDDNSFYLDHTIEKKYNPFGIPFADYRVSISPEYQSDNVTIYGHAAKDGSFFAPVKQYKDIEFYKKHPTYTFDTIYGKGLYKVVALMMVDTDISKKDVFNFHDYNDMNQPTFDFFMEEVNKRSYFHTDVDVMYGDKLLTLSTCDTEVINSNHTPYRMALVARKVRPGEVMDVDVSKAAINKNVVMPDGWIKKYHKKTPFEK